MSKYLDLMARKPSSKKPSPFPEEDKYLKDLKSNTDIEAEKEARLMRELRGEEEPEPLDDKYLDRMLKSSKRKN